MAINPGEARGITAAFHPGLSGSREGGGVKLRIRPAEPARAGQSGEVGVMLDGSLRGRTWNIKVGIARRKARDTDGPGDLPGGPQARSVSHGSSRPGLVHDSSSGMAGYRQVVSSAAAARPQKTDLPSGGFEPPRVSVNENKAMADFWTSLSRDQQRAFEAKACRRVFVSGARLMREGEQADHVAVIVSGQTEIRVCENGAERVVAVRGPGQLIGERASLEMSVRSATVVAIQIVVALVMRTEDFAAFISAYPAVLKIVEDQIYVRLREGSTGYGTGLGYPDDPEDGSMTSDRTGLRYPESAARRSPRLTGENCTVLRTDVIAFGANERNAEDHRIIRRENLAMTESALGPAWDSCRREDRGDGQLIVVSPGTPTAQVIDRLLKVLPEALKHHNRIYNDPIRIRLRVAVDVGPIEEDSLGLSGKSIIQVSRMLDAPAFKQTIDDQGALLGLIVSRFVYETYIGHGEGSLDPANYGTVPVQVKETSTTAWMQLIDPSGAVLPPRRQLISSPGYRDAVAAA